MSRGTWKCATLVALLSVASAAVANEPSWQKRHPWDERSKQVAVEQYFAGAAAAAIMVPSMLAAGAAIGRSTPNLAAAAVPALLLNVIVPPLAVTAAEFAVGRARRGAGVTRFHPAVWAAIGVNLVGVLIGSVSGVSTTDTQSYALYSLMMTLAMPAATQVVMHYTERGRK